MLIYYPDCVVDSISFIEFLYKQAKEAEQRDKSKNPDLVLRNKHKKKSRVNEKPQLTVLSLNTYEEKDIKFKKALNFEDIL